MNKKYGESFFGIAFVSALFLLLSADFCFSQDIHREVANGDLARVTKLLNENPLLVNHEDSRGCTPIYTAIAKKNMEMVKLLIEKGASVRVGDHNLRAPIHFAGFMNDKNMISLLLENGAVIDTRAIGAATPLIHSSYSNRFDLSRFLIEQGADINIQCNALTTPLYFAVLNNNMDYLKFLLKKGADIDITDFLGRSPLFIAVREGYADIAYELIENGANIFSQDDSTGQSLLHLAAIHGHNGIIRLLIEKGLSINLKDQKEYTPLDYALRYGHASTVEILKKRGGKSSRFHEWIGRNINFNRKPGIGEGIVIKLQNGSWGIRTGKHLLIFAYSETGTPTHDRSLANGCLTGNDMNTVPWVYFDLGYHPPEPRYAIQGSNPLYSMQDGGRNISFFLNGSYKNAYSMLDLKQTHFMEAGQLYETGGIRVTVIPSYRYHKGYLIECDGLKIFWLSGICDNYISEKRDTRAIESVREKYSQLDLLLLGTPEGIGPEIGNGIRETFLASEVLKPRSVIFMGKSRQEMRILKQIKRRTHVPNQIYCSENPGDRFFLPRGENAHD